MGRAVAKRFASEAELIIIANIDAVNGSRALACERRAGGLIGSC